LLHGILKSKIKRLSERRPGDIAITFADASKAEQELGRNAGLGIEDMVRDAWRFEKNNLED
jgi:UDP-glucose 4-epimerase